MLCSTSVYRECPVHSPIAGFRCLCGTCDVVKDFRSLSLLKVMPLTAEREFFMRLQTRLNTKVEQILAGQIVDLSPVSMVEWIQDIKRVDRAGRWILVARAPIEDTTDGWFPCRVGTYDRVPSDWPLRNRPTCMNYEQPPRISD